MQRKDWPGSQKSPSIPTTSGDACKWGLALQSECLGQHWYALPTRLRSERDSLVRWSCNGSSPRSSLEILGAKRSRSSPPAAPAVGRGPPPVNDDSQYTIERLLGRRNRRHVVRCFVQWQGYGEEDSSWVQEADSNPGLIEDCVLAATAATPTSQSLSQG